MDLARLLDSLRRAVERAPDDDVLRAHLAELLLQAGLTPEAIGHLGRLLAADPTSPEHLALMRRATQADAPAPRADDPRILAAAGLRRPGADPAGRRPVDPETFDWGAAEDDLIAGLAHEPVETKAAPGRRGRAGRRRRRSIEAAFLTPLRNPALRAALRRDAARRAAALRSARVRQDPSGARGRRRARRAVHRGLAGRRAQPLDGPERGQRRRDLRLRPRPGALRGVPRRGRRARPRPFRPRAGPGRPCAASSTSCSPSSTASRSANDGVFVLGATNAPWDVDVALRRPGRFDRTVFVEPPDEPGSRPHPGHASGRPARWPRTSTLHALARSTDGFSGADLATGLPHRSAERAAARRSAPAPRPRRSRRADLEAARAGITPSTGRWFDGARNVVLFADQSGEFAPLAELHAGPPDAVSQHLGWSFDSPAPRSSGDGLPGAGARRRAGDRPALGGGAARPDLRVGHPARRIPRCWRCWCAPCAALGAPTRRSPRPGQLLTATPDDSVRAAAGDARAAGRRLGGRGDRAGHARGRARSRTSPPTTWPCRAPGQQSARPEAISRQLEAAREAVLLDPVSPDAQVQIGTALAANGEPAAARAAYREALRLDPGTPPR